jgi:hypothetical protein
MKQKGDFTAERRLLWIAALAVVVCALGAYIAVRLLCLIGFFTSLFYYHQFSISDGFSRARGTRPFRLWPVACQPDRNRRSGRGVVFQGLE